MKNEDIKARAIKLADDYIGHPFDIDEDCSVSGTRTAYYEGYIKGHNEGIQDFLDYLKENNIALM